MKTLVIGRGGREHVLCECLAKSSLVSKVYVAPGNGGMSANFNVVDINEDDITGLVNFALNNNIELTVVGPEVSLSLGIVNEFLKHGLKIFGPTKEAAMIESSKEFAKDLMKKYNIPTASYEVFSDYDLAIEYIEKIGVPIVIKYDGLAAGKGVVIVNTIEEAKSTLKTMLVDKVYGNSKVVIEEFLEGIEFSLMAMVNAKNLFEMEVSQDHKQLYDGDKGPNTGGMGAYSPVDVISEDVIKYSVEKIMKPVASAMVSEGVSFSGFLYGGLILTKDGVKVIEFNARFGDPEAEVVLPRLESDLVKNILDVMDGNDPVLKWNNEYVVGVVMASKGYPEKYEKNHLIKGDLSNVYHMGTVLNGEYYTNGGRVLLVKGSGNNLEKAMQNAYKNVEKVECSNFIYRSDIGSRNN